MSGFFAQFGEVIEALHIIAVIAWMAGMLYLPRLFVYHAETAVGSETSETFKVMERRLLKAIINPAMIAVWVLGILLLWKYNWAYLQEGWMHIKLTLVIIMSGIHGMFVGHVRKFAEDKREKSAKFYRILNEVPTVLMIGIVFAVVLGAH
ncbi:MAG: protoporphyrinogen oxidase HemJ [Alphaproteobacteria bacterium]|nr:protoporphyrinogen oxidase HemJ [Alphaproteobacteria bacterium]